jgi:hypothetical protein
MYGSIFCIETFKPRASINAPIEAAASPLPREETTPPVTNINFVFMWKFLSPLARSINLNLLHTEGVILHTNKAE